MLLQKEGDATAAQIAEQSEVLSSMLDPLCGASGEKEDDDTVRENLAEAVLLLVRCTPRFSGPHAPWIPAPHSHRTSTGLTSTGRPFRSHSKDARVHSHRAVECPGALAAC